MTPSPESQRDIASKSLKRFSAGAVVGLLISASQWGGYIYFFGESIPLIKGIAFCLALSFVCGLITLKWGYKTIENLLQLLG